MQLANHCPKCGGITCQGKLQANTLCFVPSEPLKGFFTLLPIRDFPEPGGPRKDACAVRDIYLSSFLLLSA